jgi:hypothetical protein
MGVVVSIHRVAERDCTAVALDAATVLADFRAVANCPMYASAAGSA